MSARQDFCKSLRNPLQGIAAGGGQSLARLWQIPCKEFCAIAGVAP